MDLEGQALGTDLGSEAIAYLKGRGFTGETARRFRLGVVPHRHPGFERFGGRLAIPNICASGHVVGLKFRALGDEGPKYDQPAGQVARLFNLASLNTEGDLMCLCEGELDAVSLAQLDLPVCAVPGASAWKQRHAVLFEGFSRIVIVADADDAGRMLVKKILDSGLECIAIEPPGGFKDANAALVGGVGEEMKRMILG